MAGSTRARYGRDVESYLDDLPPSTNIYTYEGKEQFEEIATVEFERLEHSLRHLQSEPLDNSLDISEYFVIIIDTLSFRRDFFGLKLDVGVRQFYNPTLHTLILRMTLLEHSDIAMAFHNRVVAALGPMGLDEAIFTYGRVTINVGSGNTKEPDGDWGHRQRPRGVHNRPSVVLEVGLSEPDTKLPNDARMWVDPTEGKANMAITIRIHHRKPMVTIQTWEWDSNSQRSYVTQSCVIEKTGDNTTVSQHALTIPFTLLFRRPPSNPQETDIRLQKEDLVDLGTRVWEIQEW
ncbi:hypothetical protein N7516_000935 [Penicillium verrucosum]|uniref:uncharacterized protein n=1 Tax=Penicillium verrucosum TaxID=60171 RepID=UPI0025456AAD|nr:uncharacterized protein N7516_000935 [Penicillium verrucosum]KAJ5940767.1 hypothetical protein N7516_000935 [Penicillium verrucosum]